MIPPAEVSGTHLLGLRAGLLLSRPGIAPTWPVETRWRALLRTGDGPLAFEGALAELSSHLPRRRGSHLLARAARDERLNELVSALELPGGVADTARLLLALRLADNDPGRAAALLFERRNLGEPSPPPRELRRLFRQASLLVVVAPRVRAEITFGEGALRLLEAETSVAAGRPGHAASILEGLEDPVIQLSRLAALLAGGRYDEAVAVSERGVSRDDLGTLTLIARAVALRVLGRPDDARVALDDALRLQTPEIAVRCLALEEREMVLRTLGMDRAADADLRELGRLTATPTGEWGLTSSTSGANARSDAGDGWWGEGGDIAPLGPAGAVKALEAARARLRRRTQLSPQQGAYAGRHHLAYAGEIVELLAGGHTTAAEALLVGLIDAVEEEVDTIGGPPEPMYFLTLADLFDRDGRRADEMVVLERFAAACLRMGAEVPAEVVARLLAARQTLVGADAGAAEAVPVVGL